MSRLVALSIGLIGLLPAMAHAQTDIDEGQSPAQIFASDCATCHKSTRGLAGGRGSLMLRSFLTEHYTSNSAQAAALAAYVLGAGGADSAPPQGRPAKPEAQHARLPAEETKPSNPPSRRAEKPEGEAPTAKLQPPANEDARPGGVPSIMVEPGSSSSEHRSAARHEVQPDIVTRDRRKEAQPVSAAPRPVIAAPASHEAPPQGNSPAASAAAPTNTDSDDNAPVPRDNIPD